MKFLSTLVVAMASVAIAQDNNKGNNTSTKSQCKQVAKITKLMDIAGNSTKLDKVTDGNTTKADAIKAKAQEKMADLTAMQSNATLTSFCAGFQDKQSCKAMAKLAKEQEFAQNTTALNEKFNGDADKISKFQAKLSSKAEKVNALMSNTTLMDTCNSLGITTASTTTGASTSSDSTSDKKSAAVNVNAMGAGHVLALVSVLTYAVAML